MRVCHFCACLAVPPFMVLVTVLLLSASDYLKVLTTYYYLSHQLYYLVLIYFLDTE